MTASQAAKYLGISERTVHRLIRRGTIKAERFGHYWMIERASLDEYKVSVAGKSKNDPTRGKEE